MLRVEPSNLPHPRAALRPRRLLPHPAGTQRVGASKARHEMLPPPEEITVHALRREERPAPEELTSPQASPANERWSVRLELGDADIAKLYGQGMTRGAVVWKKGMMEWRPLLVTPELTGVLRRTRTTLPPSLPPLPSWVDAPPALPRPPRVPSSTLPPMLETYSGTPTTIAPTALDVEAPRKARRPVELAAVAVAAFTVAWLAHGAFKKPAEPQAAFNAPSASVAAASAVCEPPKSETQSATSSSTIPTVSVADLPLAASRGGVAATVAAGTTHASARVANNTVSSGGPPARAHLVEALSGVARAASSCGERGGPVRVVLSFSNSGVARSIQVSGEELPAATRSCIIGAASRARIPAFTGDPVTVSKTL